MNHRWHAGIIALLMTACSSGGAKSAEDLLDNTFKATLANDKASLVKYYLPTSKLAGCNFGNNGIAETERRSKNAADKFRKTLDEARWVEYLTEQTAKASKLSTASQAVALGSLPAKVARQAGAADRGEYWGAKRYHPGSDCKVRGFIKARAPLVVGSKTVGRFGLTLIRADDGWYIGGGNLPAIQFD